LNDGELALYGDYQACKSRVYLLYYMQRLYIFLIKITHMKTEVMTPTHLRAAQRAHNEEAATPNFAGKTGVTILLAISFLALVMCLSYLFITGTR